MSEIQLKTSAILNVPLQSYCDDFIFIVNGKEFRTNRLSADILSPVISHIHLNDPTIDTFTINTHQKGDFSNILKLIDFNQNIIPQSEVLFVLEILNILDNKFIEFREQNRQEEITVDNIFSLIKQHEKYSNYYSSSLSAEIDFVSSHFFELCESKKDDLANVSIETLIKIISNDKLQLDSEDQLLNFINDLYLNDSNYCILYEYVYFINVKSQAISQFLDICDMNDFTAEIWEKLKERLKEEINVKDFKPERYIEKGEKFEFNTSNPFNGILNYFVAKTNGNIENDVNITASSIHTNYRQPINVIQYNGNHDCFYSNNEPNSWLCFDFKEHRVNLSHYTIKTGPYPKNNNHPKDWVIEGSNDNTKWETLDEHKDCSIINGESLVHTFQISKQNNKSFRFIRYHQTGTNWANNNHIMLHSFELHGNLI